MPNQINIIRATVTTYRSNSPVAFFDTPQDATPQDCLEITEKLLSQATAVLNAALLDSHLVLDTALQLQVLSDLLYRAQQSLDMLDIAKAVAMAEGE